MDPIRLMTMCQPSISTNKALTDTFRAKVQLEADLAKLQASYDKLLLQNGDISAKLEVSKADVT